jgi:hypothetical protein
MHQRSKIVKHYFRTIAALSMTLMVSSAVLTLNADELDKKTIIKIDQSIEVQGTVLPAGSYVLKVLDRYAVQIFNTDEKHVFATILANPAYRLEDRADSEFRFYDAVAGKPPALHTWFYPGDNTGFEFGLSREAALTQSGRRQPNAPTSHAGGESSPSSPAR